MLNIAHIRDSILKIEVNGTELIREGVFFFEIYFCLV